MSIRLLIRTRHSLWALCVSAGLILPGCSSWPAVRPWEPLWSSVQESGTDKAPSDDLHERLEALRSPIARRRLEALQAWSESPPNPLPTELLDLRTDPNPQVRATVLTILARARSPQALAYLTVALHDTDLQVRTAAIAALGELGGPEAQAALEDVLKTQTEVLRAAAVTALANLGAYQAAMEAANDRSWRVRLAVARTLRHAANRQGFALAQRLLDDPSVGVQQEAVKAVATWPLAQAGPLLLEAMGRNCYTTRKTACQELSSQWPPASQFLVDAPAERRAEVLAQLQQRFREEIGPTEITLVAAALTGEEASCKTTEYLSPADIQTHHNAVQTALDRLGSDDMLIRRRAASQLAEQTRRHPLSLAALARLEPLMAKETDPLVWQDVLDALASDDRESAARLAEAALKQTSPEVRRRACLHFAAHPDIRYAPALLHTLADEDLLVAGAAARALGALDHLDEIEPLRRLLANRNELLRVEVAAALTRLQDPAGLPALQRLAYSTEPAVRRHLAIVLGELANRETVPLLIHLLDDRPDIRRAALESLPKVVGQDLGKPLGKPPCGPEEQAALWKEWFAHQPQTASLASPSPVRIPPPNTTR